MGIWEGLGFGDLGYYAGESRCLGGQFLNPAGVRGSLPAKQVSTYCSGFWARSSLLARSSAAFPPRNVEPGKTLPRV